MAKNIDIKVRSWVHKGGELVEFRTLPPEERKEVATQLKLTYLNALYAGRVKFEIIPDT